MKYNKIFTIIISVIILVSCQNEEIIINTPKESVLTINDYFKVLNMKPNGGEIKVESNATVDFQNSFRVNSIVATDKNRGLLTDYNLREATSSKNIDIMTNDGISKIFGSKIKYSLGEVSNKQASSDETYIPELLVVNVSTDVLQAGTIISWNVDASNENGLILWYEYSPSFQDKKEVLEGNLKYIRGAITIPDSMGEYTITESDISILPNLSRVSYHVTRAGFNISNDAVGKQIALIAATTVTKDLRVMK